MQLSLLTYIFDKGEMKCGKSSAVSNGECINAHSIYIGTFLESSKYFLLLLLFVLCNMLLFNTLR